MKTRPVCAQTGRLFFCGRLDLFCRGDCVGPAPTRALSCIMILKKFSGLDFYSQKLWHRFINCKDITEGDDKTDRMNYCFYEFNGANINSHFLSKGKLIDATNTLSLDIDPTHNGLSTIIVSISPALTACKTEISMYSLGEIWTSPLIEYIPELISCLLLILYVPKNT